MIIKASDLKNGVEVDSKKWTLWWNPKNQKYEITDYAKTKNVQYRYANLHDAVRTLNSLTGWLDTGEDDEGGD